MSENRAQQDEIRRKLKRYQAAVRPVLFHEWDPIGIAEYVPEDEYDSYVDQICGKLLRGENAEQLAAYLDWAETGNMGLSGSEIGKQRLTQVVQRLLQIRDEIESSAP